MVSHQNHISLGSFENINKKEEKDLNLKNDQNNLTNKIQRLKTNIKNKIPEENIIQLNDCLKEKSVNI